MSASRSVPTVPTFSVEFPPQPETAQPLMAPPPEALQTEWLLTNGLGSFVMGTAAGTPTRRYHSLLTSAQRPPVQRINLLNSVVDSVAFDGQTYNLSNFEFGTDDGTVFHPDGFRHLRRCEKDLSVRWHFECGPIRVIRQLQFAWHRDVAVLSYHLEPATATSDTGSHLPETVTLSIRPLISLRDFHHQRRSTGFDPFQVQTDGPTVTIATDALPPLCLRTDAAFTEQRDWWYGFKRRIETARSQDDTEDLFCPGVFEQTFTRIGQEVTSLHLYASTAPLDELPTDIEAPRRKHLERLTKHLVKQVGESEFLPGSTLAALAAASDDFVVCRTVDNRQMTTILAGYPWFADWGRDTMISLPGLLMVTGRFDEAKKTLTTYARHIRNGLVPNRFDDYGGEPHYNTVDASLWFIHAALEYVRMTDDQRTWNQTLSEACRQIIAAYQRGTDGPIHMDRDGLIVAGNLATQLTWMDAKRDGVVFTPRHGKAVEINALWYRALVGCAAGFEQLDKVAAESYRKVAAKVKRSFNRVFWNDELGFLIDHVSEEHVDQSCRPNQVLAVALPDSPLSATRQKKVMEQVRNRLLTPFGLRTLPPDDWHYHGHYGGSMFDRDRAYHQGTVWGWLIGPYVEGWLRAFAFSEKARAHAREALSPLLKELGVHSLGQLHEIYSGDPPHEPEGTMAQAWTVAEVLRAAVMVEVGAPGESAK